VAAGVPRRWCLGNGAGTKAKKPIPPWITALFGHSPYQLIVAAVIAGLLLALLINGLAVLTDTSTPSSLCA